MYSLKTPCSCGKMVLAENLMAHQMKKGCQRNRALGERKAEKGGPNPLFECECGMILDEGFMDSHRDGEIHHRFIRFLEEGSNKCTACFAPYKCSKESHESSNLHDEFFERRKQFIAQTARKEMRVWESNEEEITHQQEQINQLQIRLENLEIQESRENIENLNEQYDLLHEEVQRERLQKEQRLNEAREAGLRRREEFEQRRIAAERARNQRRPQQRVGFREERIPQRNEPVQFIEDERVEHERRRREIIIEAAQNADRNENERNAHRGFSEAELANLQTALVTGHCSICIEDLENVQGIRLPCAHIYHTDCLKTMLKRDSRCPQCRLNLREEIINVEY